MNNKTLGSIESFTGGLFAATITKKANSSKFFKGAIVAYNLDIKEKLGIDISHGVVNKKVAYQMAMKGKEFLDVDICVAFTGVAGPSKMENKDVGLVYIAINNMVYEKHFDGSRENIRESAVRFAIKKMKDIHNLIT